MTALIRQALLTLLFLSAFPAPAYTAPCERPATIDSLARRSDVIVIASFNNPPIRPWGPLTDPYLGKEPDPTRFKVVTVVKSPLNFPMNEGSEHSLSFEGLPMLLNLTVFYETGSYLIFLKSAGTDKWLPYDMCVHLPIRDGYVEGFDRHVDRFITHGLPERLAKLKDRKPPGHLYTVEEAIVIIRSLLP